MARSAKFCLLSAWKWCHLLPLYALYVPTKCVRLCTCIIGIKFCEQQQPMLRLMFNLNTAMMPAGLCTMGVTLFLKKHSQFPPRPTFSRDNICFKKTWTIHSSYTVLRVVQVFFETDVIYCHKFMLHTLLGIPSITYYYEWKFLWKCNSWIVTITGLNLRTNNELWFEAVLNLLGRALLLAIEAELGWWTQNWKFGSEKKSYPEKTAFKLINVRISSVPKIVPEFFFFLIFL